ncbi:MAG: hypothetical protein ABW360_11020 [Phenylobacterium sp.]
MTTKIGPAAVRSIRSWGLAPVTPIKRRDDRVRPAFDLDSGSAPTLAAAGPLLAPDAMAVLIEAQARLAA